MGLLLKKRDYVEVVSDDEWSGLIGVVEEFVSDQGVPLEEVTEHSLVQVFIPLAKEEMREYRLEGVNQLTGYVRQELRQNHGMQVFSRTQLEHFDSENL